MTSRQQHNSSSSFSDRPVENRFHSCFSFPAVEMRSGKKSCDEESLVGRRVKVSWREHKEFTQGFVLHTHSGKKLVVCTDGVEEYLKGKRGNGGPVNDAFSNQATKQSYPTHASSDAHQEGVAATAYGDELVGCRVKILRVKSNTLSEGLVGSYNRSNKKHLVVFNDGVEEMLNLSKHIETVEDVSDDQAYSPARGSSYMYTDDDMESDSRRNKKQKGPSTGHATCCTSYVMSKAIPETHITPIDSKSSSIMCGDDLVDVCGYKVKTSASPILEAIFDKYDDIAARCVFSTSSVRASLLEVICNIVRRLQHHDLEAVLSDLENITSQVADIAASGINVSWLNEHLSKFRKIVPFKEKRAELRKAEASMGVLTEAASNELKKRQAKLLLAEKRFKQANKQVEALNIIVGKMREDILESEEEEYFWRRRLDELP